MINCNISNFLSGNEMDTPAFLCAQVLEVVVVTNQHSTEILQEFPVFLENNGLQDLRDCSLPEASFIKETDPYVSGCKPSKTSSAISMFS